MNLSITTSNRIENTVAQVAEEAAEYARKRDVCFLIFLALLTTYICFFQNSDIFSKSVRKFFIPLFSCLITFTTV